MKMALFDKFKEATQKAKEQYEVNKQIREEKRAAEEAYKREMNNKASQFAEEIINKIEENYKEDLDGFFSANSKDVVMKYTKDFYEKILLPASSMKKSYISMYPYIDSSQNDKLIKTFGVMEDLTNVIVHIKDKESQEFVLTYDNFYFKLALPEDKKYFSIGHISAMKVSLFSLIKKEGYYSFMCDDVEVGQLKIVDGREEDFITLNKFFEDMKNQDFEITNEEIDKTIQKKIGIGKYEEIKKYFVDDDELMIFFAWGGDGSDYTVCTTNQIIAVDKEAFGYSMNAKQFFYDDIQSVTAVQNTNDSSLTGMLFDAVWSSVFKDSDLKISAIGSYMTIKGMKKIEADRIVAIYNAFKKDIKKFDRDARMLQSQALVQQEQPDILDQLEKLGKLKEAGILTEEEFNQKKASLLEKL